MITENKEHMNQMWLCTEYGVTMSAAYASAFCARRFAAANHKDAARISFSHCRTCARGSNEYVLAGGGKFDNCMKSINTLQTKLELRSRFKRVMNNNPSHTRRKDEEHQGDNEL